MTDVFPYGRFGTTLSGVVNHGSSRGVKRRYPEAHPPPSYKRARVGDFPNPLVSAMARGSTATRPRYRRRSRRRRPYGRRRRTVALLAPHKKLIRCKAVQHWSHTTHVSGSMDMSPVQMNSCLDPFVTQGTGQPLGFDQWRALYENAYVIGAKVTVTYHNADAISYMVGITPMDEPAGTTSLANYEYYMEKKGTTRMLLTPDVDKITLTSKVGLKRWVKVKDLLDTNEYRINLNTPAEPSKQLYFHVWTQPTNQASTDTNGIEMVVEVEYLLCLVHPVVPARSVA